jgi:hypothetical protein
VAKPKIKYAANKKAFDTVMQAYRDAKDPGISAASLASEGRAAPNPARPTFADFRCDVDNIISALVAGARLVWFRAAYVLFDSADPIEQEVHADKLMGPGRHELEQSLGAAFKKRHLYPLRGKKGYFYSVRQERAK